MWEKIVHSVKQEGKILLAAFTIGLLLAVGVAAYSYAYSQGVQQDIADHVIRFHVKAHSNSPQDQGLKDDVKLEVLAAFEAELANGTCIEATRQTLTNSLDKIAAMASDVIQEAGFHYPVAVSIGQVFFPTRFYGSVAFPPGMYEAVQIVIGSGAGDNWWCLMFPPLCYVDMTATEESRNQLQGTISPEGVRLLMHQEEESTSLTVRFRVVEWWQNRNRPDSQPAPQLVERLP